MACLDLAQFLPGGRHGPRRSRVFVLVGGLAILTIYLFASRLPAMQQLAPVPAISGPAAAGTAGQSGMTSWLGAKPAEGAPHHHHASNPPASEDPEGYKQLLNHLEKQEEVDRAALVSMNYGTNKHPPFKDDPPHPVRDLPPEHIPSYTPQVPSQGPGGGGDAARGKRLVIVGDVHGHLVALKALLRKIRFDRRHGDHLVLAGDMVTKGPDSKGVVQFAMDIGASAVRGNQDDKVLTAARELQRPSVDDPYRLTGEPAEEIISDGDRAKAQKKDHARHIARSLSRAQLDWLRSLPFILRIGHLPDAITPPWDADTIAVVHGGLVPGTPLEKQDPWAVMNMRSLVYPRRDELERLTREELPKYEAELEADTTRPETATETEDPMMDTVIDALDAAVAVAVPIDTRDGEPWSHAWNRHQNTLPPTAPRTAVIYGHDAKSGLQVNPEVDISPYDPSGRVSPFFVIPQQRPKHRKQKHKHKDKNKHHNKPDHHREDDSDAGDGDDDDDEERNRIGTRYAFGLDTGCGHGRQLTALVLEAVGAKDGGGVAHRIVQVDCARAYAEVEEENEGEGDWNGEKAEDIEGGKVDEEKEKVMGGSGRGGGEGWDGGSRKVLWYGEDGREIGVENQNRVVLD